MQERIIKFITALRSAGVRISLAESADAMKAVEVLGVMDKENFRHSLLATLIKDSGSIPIFEELFPFFFDSNSPPPFFDSSDDLSPEEASLLAEALRQLRQDLQDMIERLLHGDPLGPQELDQLGQMVGLNQANDLRYREWMAQRMEKAMKYKEVQQAIRELLQMLEELGLNRQKIDQLQQLLDANQRAMKDQLRQYAGIRITENMSEQPPEERLESLIDRPFGSLTDRELEILRKEIQRLAAALKTRVALRQKRSKHGQMDAKATIRTNLKHGNVPFKIKYKDHTLKPKLVVICDISTSMRACSELMLSMLHAMQDQISKTHAFAFIDHLEYISPDFQTRNIRDAVLIVLDRMPPGHYNTDLGYGLMNFTDHYFDKIDSRSTFIIVGDGRNNHNDPRIDLFRKISRRANRTIWINPETQTLWGTGDSDMLKYAPHCNKIFQVATLAELTEAIDHLFAS